MGTLALSNNTIDKYFGYLRKLDNNSKKKLIINLTESIQTNEDKPFDLKKHLWCLGRFQRFRWNHWSD